MFLYSLLKSGATLPEIIICVLALALAAGISIILHEIAHGYIALKCGDPTAKNANRLTLNPLVHFDPVGLALIVLVGFGWAKPVPVNPSNFKNPKRDMVLVSVAGVCANLIMCGLGLAVLYLLYPFFMVYINPTIYLLQMLGYYFLIFLININFMLAFFNMLPIYPLDGFRLINVFLKPNNAFSRFMYRYGSWCIIILVVLGNVFRSVGLEYLDVFYWANKLISSLVSLVAR